MCILLYILYFPSVYLDCFAQLYRQRKTFSIKKKYIINYYIKLSKLGPLGWCNGLQARLANCVPHSYGLVPHLSKKNLMKSLNYVNFIDIYQTSHRVGYDTGHFNVGAAHESRLMQAGTKNT